MPLVSVIIPNYNHAPFLNQRIDSVLDQTFQDFEVIILDDCSTDDSRKVIEDYRNHPKISHIILNEMNSGSPFKQWEKGIALAKGEWIWIAESDDWCESNFLNELFLTVNLFDSKEISIAYTQTFVYNNVTGFVTYDIKKRKIVNYINKENFVEERMLPRPSIMNASMAIFKKNSYVKISKDFENYKYCGDWLFWTEIGRTGDAVEVGKLLSYHRYHPNNTYNTNYKLGNTFKEELDIISKIEKQNWAPKSAVDNAYMVYYNLFLNLKKTLNTESINNVNLLFSKYIHSSVLRKRNRIYFAEKCLFKLKLILERFN